ncbi:MAG: helix-turn-helix domain-containing protein [Melioribacteraceae bacterium]|nr:helix-turn-helix domain-containing protein [Melioribacteraceae bacterium]
MRDLVEIGKEIKKRRILLGINQDSLVEIAGISVRSLKSIEAGNGNPGIKQLTKVLNALGLRLTMGVK